uniref:Uncharacterized protein n=1 Tax=Tanacetum cinerariifolium TaxID=118510 RepID=A0A699RJM2_TANCI|nr:hypothetical protein [Tanacetum cinerariifolium]
MNFIITVGKKNGVSASNVRKLVSGNTNCLSDLPGNDSERFDQIFDLVDMMLADGITIARSKPARAASISASVMVSGGAMRSELSQNKNQSVRMPSAASAWSIMGLSTSNDSNSTAISRPQLRTSRMAGCCKPARSRAALAGTAASRFSS